MSELGQSRTTFGAYLIPLVAAAIGVFGIVRNLDTGSNLRDGAVAPAVDTQYRKNKPRAPIIEIDGDRHICTGGVPLVELEAPVRYDPDDPSDCRLEQSVGTMTSRERFGLGLSIATLIFAAGLAVRLRRDD